MSAQCSGEPHKVNKRALVTITGCAVRVTRDRLAVVMIIRLDAALRPPGWIASASMFTLVLKENCLFILRTGPGVASQRIYTQGLLQLRQAEGSLANMAINAVVKNCMTQVLSSEAAIQEDQLRAEHLSADKANRVFKRNDISNVRTKVRSYDIRLDFKASGKKFKFECSKLYQDIVMQLAEALNA